MPSWSVADASLELFRERWRGLVWCGRNSVQVPDGLNHASLLPPPRSNAWLEAADGSGSILKKAKKTGTTISGIVFKVCPMLTSPTTEIPLPPPPQTPSWKERNRGCAGVIVGDKWNYLALLPPAGRCTVFTRVLKCDDSIAASCYIGAGLIPQHHTSVVLDGDKEELTHPPAGWRCARG